MFLNFIWVELKKKMEELIFKFNKSFLYVFSIFIK